MIGIVIVTHGRLGSELVDVASDIVGKAAAVVPVSIGRGAAVDDARMEIETAIKRVESGDGVLLFTDMFGGTPSNLSLSFLEGGKAEVICGVNLPMLIKAFISREGRNLKELARYLKEYGEKSISLASEILEAKHQEHQVRGG